MVHANVSQNTKRSKKHVHQSPGDKEINPVGVKEEMIGDKGLECGYCDSQFLTTREGYIRLHLHQIIYHGDVVNDGESKVGTRIKG